MRFIVSLLFPFSRAPRWQFWLVLVLTALLFVPIIKIPLGLANVPVPDALANLDNIIPGGIFGAMAMAAAGLYLLLVGFATRLHDRGRTGFWVFIMLLPLAAIAGLIWVQANPTAVPLPVEMFPLIDTVNKVLGGIAGLLLLWLLVASMFFPGTHGRNWFGRDPSGDEVESTHHVDRGAEPA